MKFPVENFELLHTNVIAKKEKKIKHHTMQNGRVEQFDGRFTSAVDISCVSFQPVFMHWPEWVYGVIQKYPLLLPSQLSAVYFQRNRNIHTQFEISVCFFWCLFRCAGIFGWQHFPLDTCIHVYPSNTVANVLEVELLNIQYYI